MSLFEAFFNLIRWKNIVIVAIAQLLVWWCIILPLSISQAIFLQPFQFVLLCLSTLMLAAAGYIINDYFDIRIDLRNRPEKVIIGKIIKQRWAMFWHSLFNVLGIGIAFYLAKELGNPYLVTLQVVTTILLWLYSTHLKRMFVSGNVCVAMLTALSIATVAIYEPALLQYAEDGVMVIRATFERLNPIMFIGVYIYFAFFLTWMREIVKDMEDFKGDAEEGCVTMPIKIGIKKTNTWIYVLGVITLLPILYSVLALLKVGRITHEFGWYFFTLYVIVCILLPLVLFLLNIGKKATAVHYEKMSKRLKWLMVLGLVTLPIYYYLH